MSRPEDKKLRDVQGTGFRNIDVDQYNENSFKEDDGPTDGQEGPDEAEILSLLNEGKQFEALTTVLKQAPLGCKNQHVRESARSLATKVMLSIRPHQMDEYIEKLDKNLLEVLMKYVYRGFELPSENSSAHLLIWHEKIYKVSGVGSIVRVFSDSKKA